MLKTSEKLELLITAEQAYPAFETAVLMAKHRIDMGFRIFDARTPLISDAAREIGETWIDLLLHKLNQGVRVKIAITDFDPVVRPDMHHLSWKSFRVLAGVAEMSDNPSHIDIQIADHPARVGWGPRMVLWPKIMTQLGETCEKLNELPPEMRADQLRSMPRFAELVKEDDGRLLPDKTGVPQMIPVTHHQKVAVIDDQFLYIGGLDMNERRIDSTRHTGRPEQTWHDVHLLLRCPRRAVAARRHLDRFQAECAGEVGLRPPPELLRTLSVKRSSEGIYLSPVVSETGILDCHLRCIAKATNLIYLESQFFRDPIISDALVKRASEAPDLGLVVVLPAAPEEVAFLGDEGLDHRYGEYLQAKCLNELQKAFAERLFIGSPAKLEETQDDSRAALHGAPIIFIHSKVSVFDNRRAIISSANINGRSMRWDTELGVEITDAEEIAKIRSQVMRCWLPRDAGPEFCAPNRAAVAHWQQLADLNAATSPQSRRGFILPYDVTAAEAFGTLLPGVPVEMV
ncbi:phospholipase D family protein [uncultured Roseobacter sp.]|uniref:phospholipase D family protein n=1 Tax=uncultured Roseobacter sp. TaxID=114847 RepID=UPI00262004CB|nr:phospholipase D family protein [uncultured Roseobacter sp.]